VEECGRGEVTDRRILGRVREFQHIFATVGGTDPEVLITLTGQPHRMGIEAVVLRTKPVAPSSDSGGECMTIVAMKASTSAGMDHPSDSATYTVKWGL